MIEINEDVIDFLQKQSYVVVSTIDKKKFPHSSCKGIIKVEPKGIIYLLDLYRSVTYRNLKYNHHLSVTAVDEHKFRGYCLKGKAKLSLGDEMRPDILKAWSDKIAGRLTQRLLKNIREDKGSKHHPEALLPNPEYMIRMEVEEIVNLTPP